MSVKVKVDDEITSAIAKPGSSYTIHSSPQASLRLLQVSLMAS